MSDTSHTEGEAYVVDRTGWPAGPWDGEPDRLELREHGFPCLIVRSGMMGALCGYVGVPPGHPYHGTHYGEIDGMVGCHGGLTYSDRCADHICHIAQPGEPADVWWLGFDCGHCFDFKPGQEASIARYVGRAYRAGHNLESYKAVDYVRAEVSRLAEQLAEVMP